MDGNCFCNADINVTGTSYLNGDAAVGGGCSFNNDINVTGTSYLNGNAVVTVVRGYIPIASTTSLLSTLLVQIL